MGGTELKNRLAIVIITRNEAQHVERCLAAILQEMRSLPDAEVMLVDSASTDGTIDIACKFPISIIQLQPHWPLTPGAGRYIGTRATSSEYILFLDGDTEPYPGWILRALDFLRQHPEVGGVGGTLDEYSIDEHGLPAGEVLHRYQVQKAREVKSLGGNGLYRRAALDEAGSFDPYLALYEEAELALRLRKAGFTLWRLPLPMARHFSPPRHTLREAIRRFQVGFYPKAGRTLRAAYKNGLAGQFIREFLMNYIVTGSYLLIGMLAFTVALTGRRKWLMAWLISSVAILMAYSVRKRSLRRAINNLLARLMVVYGLIAGFVTGGQDATQYPTDVIVLRHQGGETGNELSGTPSLDRQWRSNKWQQEIIVINTKKRLMRPVLTFFFDALKPESLEHMPFLRSFAHKRRMRSELGHSVTCHPSMYSGVHPNKHRQWFVWKYDPVGSPFKWARVFKYLGFVDNLPARYFLHKYTRTLREGNTAWFGVPLLVNLPLKYWPYFNVVEDRSWDEPGYLKEYPTVFDILRRYDVDFEVVGMTKGAGSEFVQIGEHEFGEIRPWTYFFLGSVDGYSHKYGQDAPETVEQLRRLDQLVEAKYQAYSQRVPDFDVFVFSDHGHIRSERRVDIHNIFRQHGHNLNRFIHLVESNYARFWFRNDSERAVVERVLSTVEEGFILTNGHLQRYHLEMPDNRYGDLVFYLDAPYLFTKTIWGFSRGQKSMHGYLPDYPDSDGVFLCQRPLIDGTHVELVDVLPTLLNSLGIPVPDYVDGRVLWKETTR